MKHLCIHSNSSIFQTHLPLILRPCSKWWKKLHPCLGFPHQLSTIFQRKIDMSTGLKFDLRFQQGILPSCPLERLTIGTFSKKSYMYLGLHNGKWAQSFETTSFLKSNNFCLFSFHVPKLFSNQQIPHFLVIQWNYRSLIELI